MQEVSFEQALAEIQAKDPRYQRDAYVFVREALEFTQKNIAKDGRRRVRHITGQELLGGIRAYALQQFGPMAKLLLEEWGVRSCEDFGEIVFNMVDVGWLAKTRNDSRADFAGGYEFDEAFRKPFLPSTKQTKETNEAKPQGSVS